MKPPPTVEETYRGVAAPSRKKVEAAPEVTEMPKVPPGSQALPSPDTFALQALTTDLRSADQHCQSWNSNFNISAEQLGPFLLAATSAVSTVHLEGLSALMQWLDIKPTDDDKTKAKKKKLQKSFKSKMRFQEMDMVTKKKQQSWLDFKSGKGAKKKVGLLVLSYIFSKPALVLNVRL